jgi:hypothetical protein
MAISPSGGIMFAMGFFDRVARGWGFVKEAFVMAKEDRVLLKPSVYSVAVGILYWIIWVGIFIGAEVDFDQGSGKVLGVLATFGSFVIFYFFMGMTVNMVDVHIKGGKPSLSEAFADARQNFGAILFLSVISTIVEMVSKAVRRSSRDSDSLGGAVVLSLVASLIESVWTVISFLLLPAIIIEDASLGDALRRVRSISKGNYMQIGIGEVGVRVVTNLIGFVVFAVLFGVLYLSFGVLGGNAGTVIGVGVGGTILCLYVAFASYLRMAYYTCLYLWAADLVDKGPQSPAPLPLAKVLNP